MIITGAWTAGFAVLAGLGYGDPWTAVAAILLGALLVITAGDPELREFAAALDLLLLALLLAPLLALFRRRRAEVGADTLAVVCDPCNGKPGRCTCSSKCSNEVCGAADTGIRGWSDAEMAYLKGETDVMPK